MFIILSVVILWIYLYDKIPQLVHFKYMQFASCQL